MTRRRSSGLSRVQLAISANVRPQPAQQPDAASIVQIRTQGVSMLRGPEPLASAAALTSSAPTIGRPGCQAFTINEMETEAKVADRGNMPGRSHLI
jgi:hypothetical protein